MRRLRSLRLGAASGRGLGCTGYGCGCGGPRGANCCGSAACHPRGCENAGAYEAPTGWRSPDGRDLRRPLTAITPASSSFTPRRPIVAAGVCLPDLAAGPATPPWTRRRLLTGLSPGCGKTAWFHDAARRSCVTFAPGESCRGTLVQHRQDTTFRKEGKHSGLSLCPARQFPSPPERGQKFGFGKRSAFAVSQSTHRVTKAGTHVAYGDAATPTA